MLRRILVILVAAATLVALPQADAAEHRRVEFAAWPSGNFGHLLIGESEVRKYFVRNPSRRATGRLRVALSGSPAFKVPAAKDRCSGKNLRPGDRCRITVRFTPAFVPDPVQPALLTGDADGALTVRGERRSHQVARRSLAGVGETTAMRTARPICESTAIAGVLSRGQVTGLWRCAWPYGDEETYNARLEILDTVCRLTGAIGVTRFVPVDGVVYSHCTSQGG